MSDTPRNFMTGLLAGDYLLEEIDDLVDFWHDETDGSEELHQFLGMTWAEYALWAGDPDSLSDIVSARVREIPLEQAVNDNYRAQMKLAARSDKASKIAYLQQWIERQLKGDSRY